ncbi:MAG: hypothetical protein ACE5HO_06160 [bacterium]
MAGKKLGFSVLFLLIVPVLGFGQVRKAGKVEVARALTAPAKAQGILGFIGLDASKFSMSHSYTMSFTSVGGHGFSQGLYLNTMKYQLSNPMSLYLQIGFLSRPFGSFGGKSSFDNQLFISGAGLEYKPSENLKVQFEFSQTPGSIYSPYYGNSFYRRSHLLGKNKEQAKQ